MKKHFVFCLLFSLSSSCLSGCGMIGDKTASISIIYGATAILSLLILLCYCLLSTSKEKWFLLLFSSICVVNIGYLALSISRSLSEGLLANRISYLGSVFLPFSMLMITLNVLHIKYPKWTSWLLIFIGLFVFAVAASPGYLDIYYREVTLETSNGVSVLNKVYGPWHSIYLFYLVIYFTTMLVIIIYAATKKKNVPVNYAVLLLIAVSVNIGVWLIEQLVKLDFEVLSISYIISESFLLGLHIIMAEHEKLKKHLSTTDDSDKAESLNTRLVSDTRSDSESCERNELHEQFLSNLEKLTKTERIIFDLYIAGKTTKEILNELCITENTLKFHNKNIYSKMEVSSRKQLIEINRQIETTKTSA